MIRRLGSEDPERRARDEMVLKVEGVVNGSVHAEKTLGGASRLEPLHFALSSSHRLMRVFCPIARPQSLLMRTVQSRDRGSIWASTGGSAAAVSGKFAKCRHLAHSGQLAAVYERQLSIRKGTAATGERGDRCGASRAVPAA